MSLSEETLSAKANLQMPFTSCQSAIKSLEQIRQELAEQTAAYFAKGGTIKTQQPAKNVLIEPEQDKTVLDEKRKLAARRTASKTFVNSPIAFHDGKNRANDMAASGHQNISLKKTKSGVSYSVIIGKTSYGTFAEIKDAIAKRDAQREILGMEKAYY